MSELPFPCAAAPVLDVAAAIASFYYKAHSRLRCSTIRLPFAGLASMKDALRLSLSGEGYGGLWIPPRPAFEAWPPLAA